MRWFMRKRRGLGPHCLPLALGYRLTKESGPRPLSKPYYSVQSQGLLQRKVNTHTAVSRDTEGSKSVNRWWISMSHQYHLLKDQHPDIIQISHPAQTQQNHFYFVKQPGVFNRRFENSYYKYLNLLRDSLFFESLQNDTQTKSPLTIWSYKDPLMAFS